MAHTTIVGAFLRDGHRVLLCHRSAERLVQPAIWDVPGGHVEPGETRADALRRELHEELGIHANVHGEPLVHVQNDHLDFAIWVVDKWDGVPSNVDHTEHDEIRWVTSGEARLLPLASNDYIAWIDDLTDSDP